MGGGVGLGAGIAGGGDVEFVDTILQVVKFEPVAGTAEGVGEDDLGARFDEVPVHFADAVGVEDVPFFRRVAVGEAGAHEGCTGCTVGEEVGVGLEEGLEGVHGVSLRERSWSGELEFGWATTDLEANGFSSFTSVSFKIRCRTQKTASGYEAAT